MVRAHSSRPAQHNSSSNKPAATVSKSASSNQNKPIVKSNPDNKGKLSPGAIAGIVIGSIVLVLIISFAVYKIKNR